MKENKPLVSIIIPTKNSEKTLKYCLESIKRQTYDNIEIIVVDNYSDDKSVEIAKEYGARVIKVFGERTKSKNVGLRAAKGKYVLFLDSDMLLTSKVVEECVIKAESDPLIAGIVIPERSVGPSLIAKIRDWERRAYMETFIESPRFFCKNIALRVNGFDEDLIFYEEATLPIKIEKMGFKVRERINNFILHLEKEISLSLLVRKKYYYGKTAKNYLNIYNEHGVRILNPLDRIFIFIKNKDFWKLPHLAISVLIVKFLEYIATSLGLLVEG